MRRRQFLIVTNGITFYSVVGLIHALWRCGLLLDVEIHH